MNIPNDLSEFEKAAMPLIEYIKKWHSLSENFGASAVVIATNECITFYTGKMGIPYTALIREGHLNFSNGNAALDEK